MNCQDIRLLIQADLDGELEGDRRPALRDHLASCGACAEEHREMRGLRELFAADRAALGAPRADLAERVLATIAGSARESRRGQVFSIDGWRRVAAAAAAIVILVAGGFWAGRETTTASVDAHGAEVDRWMDEVLRSGADRAAVVELHQAWVRRLEQIEARAQQERDAAYRDFDEGIRKLQKAAADTSAEPGKK